MKILEILILIVPAVVFKLYRDINGRKHPDPQGVGLVFLIMWCIVIFLSDGHHWTFILKCWLVSITGFGLFFNPLMNWRLAYRFGYDYEEGRLLYIFNHLSPKAWPDRWFLKYGVHWAIRLLIYVVLFTLSIIWFVWNG